MNFEIGSLENAVPIKPYTTLSKRQCQKRLEVMYRNLVRNVIASGARHLRAKAAVFRHYQAFLKAEALIEKWNDDHKTRRHLLSRQSPEIYPWGRRITPQDYRKSMQRRHARLEENLAKAERKLDEAVKRFDERIAFIRSGMAWLATQDRDFLVCEQQNNSEDVDSNNSTISSQSITFLDPEIAFQSRSGVRGKVAFSKQRYSLIGDGLELDDNMCFAAKLADRGYLRAAVAHHFFWSAQADLTTFEALAFDYENFLNHRREATDVYLAPKARPVERYKIVGEKPGERFEYYPTVYQGVESDASEDKVTLSSRTSQKLSVIFRSTGEIIKEGAISGRNCDPVFVANSFAPFKQAVLNADAGRSFMITGAAGTGKSSMVPGLTSYFLANGHSVKIIAASGTLDMIEARCRRLMADTTSVVVPMFWTRGPEYLVFFPSKKPNAVKCTLDTAETTKAVVEEKFNESQEHQPHVLIIDDSTKFPFHSSFVTHYKQVIILGDKCQLSVAKSVYDNAESANLPKIQMPLNYRSKNCDTMVWSNVFVYNNTIACNSLGEKFSELHYVPLGRGNKGVVELEGDAVLSAIRKSLHTGETVGVIAFSKQQLRAIMQRLSDDERSRLEFIGTPDEVLGKQADNVIISLGVALNYKDRLPVTLVGFEDSQAVQRVNVALSRSRLKNIIFSSVVPNDFDLRVATAAQLILLSILETFAASKY
ncbi:AAA domain-containing protein [Brucella pseudogrignonensis]|uniref:AAA domain-containing protein n=1 Tax=Brucella pseudogrignonensis TaxID=419475 RepID=UPI0038D01AC8